MEGMKRAEGASDEESYLYLGFRETHILVTFPRTNILLMDKILQLRLVVCPTIYKVLYIPGGAGFCPSTFSHLKMDDWKMIVSFWDGFLAGAMLVSGRALL